MPKPPSQRAGLTERVDPDAAERLANELADKPFGQAKQPTAETQAAAADRFVKLSISLPESMAQKIQKAVYENKMAGKGHKTNSAIIREALEKAGW